MRYAADLSVSGWFFATGGVVCFSFDTTLALRAETKTTNLAWEERIYTQILILTYLEFLVPA
jgi:hypothetical protein